MVGDGRNGCGGVPPFAAVGRGESQHPITSGVFDRHNDGSARLDDWLASDAGGEVGSIAGWRPGQPAVGGGAHPDAVLCAGIVPLDVAMSEVEAGVSVVAGNS